MDTISLLPGKRHRKRKRQDGPDDALTPGETEVLRALKRAMKKFGNPTLREIASCSRTVPQNPVVFRYLRRLAVKGYVELGPPRQARSIKLLIPGEATNGAGV